MLRLSGLRLFSGFYERMKAFLPDIPFYSIHLQRETLREPYMTHLQNSLGRTVETWDASEGSELVKQGWPRKHPYEVETSVGALGCLDSHIRLLEKMVEEDKAKCIGIFEDDAELACSHISELHAFYEKAEEMYPDWDILFLGANEWVELFGANKDGIVKVKRFWGTHAFLIRASAAKKVLEDHRQVFKLGFAFPADWLYAYSIVRHKLNAYGPSSPKQLIRQKVGLISSINGKVRT